MSRTKIQVRTVTYDVEAGNLYSDTPPGLLLLLGDGSAVEVTDEALTAALDAVPERYDPDRRCWTRDVKALVTALIQQAQEARDAG